MRLRTIRLALSFVLSMAGCGGPAEVLDAAQPDAGAVDASIGDDARIVRHDAGRSDAGSDAGSSCAAPFLTCGGECTDVSWSYEHCGECNHACAPGESCVDGGCVTHCFDDYGCPLDSYCDPITGYCRPGCSEFRGCDGALSECDLVSRQCVCPGPYATCGGVCVEESATACGPTCATCPEPTNGVGEVACNFGDCRIWCAAGSRLCAGGCSVCPANVRSDDVLRSTECDGSACDAVCCDDGYRQVAGACVAATSEWTRIASLPASANAWAIEPSGDLIAIGGSPTTFWRFSGGTWTSEEIAGWDSTWGAYALASDGGSIIVLASVSGGLAQAVRSSSGAWTFDSTIPLFGGRCAQPASLVRQGDASLGLMCRYTSGGSYYSSEYAIRQAGVWQFDSNGPRGSPGRDVTTLTTGEAVVFGTTVSSPWDEQWHISTRTGSPDREILGPWDRSMLWYGARHDEGRFQVAVDAGGRVGLIWGTGKVQFAASVASTLTWAWGPITPGTYADAWFSGTVLNGVFVAGDVADGSRRAWHLTHDNRCPTTLPISVDGVIIAPLALIAPTAPNVGHVAARTAEGTLFLRAPAP